MSDSIKKYKSIPVDKGVWIFQRPGSRCWYLRIFRGGRDLKESLETFNRGYALQIARQRAEELLTLKSGVILVRDPFISGLLETYKNYVEIRNTPSCRRLNLDNVNRILEYVLKTVHVVRPLKVSDLSPEVLEAYMRERLAQGLSVATINRERCSLFSFFRRAHRRRLVRHNPVELVDPLPDVRRRIPKTLSSEELKALVCEAGQPIPLHGRGGKGVGNTRDRFTPLKDVILFAANTGARLGEIIYLEWQDVDFEHRQVRICNKVEHQVKDREDRAVGMNSLVRKMMDARLATRKEGNRWVFPSLEGTVLDRRNLLRELKVVARRAQVPWANYLILRHTALTATARSGAAPFLLREMAGHSSIRTTERYYVGGVGAGEWAPPELGGNPD